MNFTRFSLIYLATYLTVGGLGFLFIPTQFSKLLFSNTMYEEIPLRLAGMFSLLLGIVVIQIVRKSVLELYKISVLARVIGLLSLGAFYLMTSNPMFVTLFCIVGVGLVLTVFGLLKESR